MERITISLEEPLAAEFDRLIRERGYTNRSEAVRDMLRARIEAQRQLVDDASHCVANLSYVYNHHERDLAERLTALQHEHHDLCVSTTHVHLDHEHCLETLLLKGPAAAVRRLSDAVIAERGVRNGQLNLITVEVEGATQRRYVRARTPDHAPPHERPPEQLRADTQGKAVPGHSHGGAHSHGSGLQHVHLKPRG